MNKFDALNLIALKGALKPDGESNLRYVMRWYSKTFFTPLHDVPDLPIEDVWLAFFEERYHGMKREDLEEQVALALETPEERNSRVRAEEDAKAQEDAFVAMSEKMARTAPKPVPLPANPDPAGLLSQIPNLPETMPDAANREAVGPLEPDIKMTFVDPDEMERLMNGQLGDSK